MRFTPKTQATVFLVHKAQPERTALRDHKGRKENLARRGLLAQASSY